MSTDLGRHAHTFEFPATRITEAATKAAEYHREREAYWRGEYDSTVTRVEETIGAKVVKHPVTNGYNVEVVVDYGDQDAYTRMQQAFRKINRHQEAAEAYESDATTYGSQDGRVYQLTRDDVRWFRLGGEALEDDD